MRERRGLSHTTQAHVGMVAELAQSKPKPVTSLYQFGAWLALSFLLWLISWLGRHEVAGPFFFGFISIDLINHDRN